LTGAFSQHAAIATLIAGIVLASLLAVFVDALARRRSYAFGLVDTRTAELEATLQERSHLEREAHRASAQAAAANQSKSEFLSRMSHELRTPLNAVIGFAGLLELEDLNTSQKECVDQIRKGGRHLLDLINEVLDITRIETGTLALSPEPVLASDVLNDVLDMMRPLARQHGIRITPDTLTTCSVYVFADRQRLKQILLNLLSNAVKYNRVGGSVRVSCNATTDRLRLNVSDNGPGIAPEHLGVLFQPFERLAAQHSDIEGTGIGLALSRRLAEVMGGTLDVETEPGHGCTFFVELPVVEGPVERYSRLGVNIPVRAKQVTEYEHTIVYIEDNLPNLRLVERVLERRGDVKLVGSMQGRPGLDLVRQHHPIVILLDLHLPDIDGEDILRELRDDPATESIPVVVLSADATPGHIQRLLAAGARTYLTKPLDVRSLLDLVDELIDEAHQSTPSADHV
jgi:signal transduction histidine kinase/ActR/RegA family two-component response regulator